MSQHRKPSSFHSALARLPSAFVPGHSPLHAATSRPASVPTASTRGTAAGDRNGAGAFYSWQIKSAPRRASSRRGIWMAGPAVAMAGLAAGLAVGLPGAAAAQPAPSGRLTSHTTAADSDPAAPLASSDAEQLATAKSAAGRAQVRQIVLALEQAAARRRAALRAEAVADERRAWGARATARAAAARAAAARAAAARQSAASPAGPAQPAASGSPQQIAQGMLASFGWSADQFSCLDSLWTQESGWNVYASNPSSGAYGIPQALPGSKMASAGPNWQTDAATQIRWGLGYIQASYGSPCGAWSHEQADGWY